MKTIGEVADLAGVSTQTLRWYDRIGLLPPRARSGAGYRLYGTEELLRLREILIWRQLGFPLGDIAALIDDPGHDRAEALRRQRELAVAQRDKFYALTRGLDVALATVDASGSVVEHEVFAGFAKSLVHDDDGIDGRRASGSEARSIPTFALLSGRSHHGTARGPSDSSGPKRIVATDPVWIAENLLALGVLPVGAGTASDCTDGRPELFWPWPDLVEEPVRDRIQNVGPYGTDRDLIERAEPDLILDLRYRRTGQMQAEDLSDGRCRYSDLCAIAPTVLLDVPLKTPGLVERLEQLAVIASVEDRVAPVVASWEARIGALREHVAGETVSACLLWPGFPDVERANGLVGHIPREEHECQLFTSLGMELTPPPEGQPAYLGGSVMVGLEGLSALTAPTLFLTRDGIPSERFHELPAMEPLSRLPAVREGRVFDLRWTNMRGGWFSYHWRLDVIARAFGVHRLRCRGVAAPVYLAVAQSGKTTVVPTGGDGVASLRGPRISGLRFEIARGIVTEIDVGGDAAADLVAFPEAYSLSIDDGVVRYLTQDRESALERVTQHQRVA
jgi:DNA-binding transcriptional MerR regulator/ABC-type Fe3+-hydroxamate transport system substrate-binding protein